MVRTRPSYKIRFLAVTTLPSSLPGQDYCYVNSHKTPHRFRAYTFDRLRHEEILAEQYERWLYLQYYGLY